MKTAELENRYLLCISNEGYEASLRVRTVYRSLRDPDVASHGLLRVIDESGEDYLFPAELFVPIEVPEAAIGVLAGVV